jgi:DNA-binding GntR family transcriptional regulator
MRVHAALRAAILDVEMRPGSAIAEQAIADRFGVSRTPVREALLRLADEGLVDIRPQRGTFVARLSLKRIEEALFVRQAVECMILERVAARGDRTAIAARLAEIVAGQAAAIEAGDVGTALDADTRFHQALVVASGLDGVWSVVAEARDLHHRIRAIAVPELGSAAQAIRDHRAIVKAVRAGDARAAVRAMQAHLARNLTLARTIARAHPDYFD